jgi:hypothetical protein
MHAEQPWQEARTETEGPNATRAEPTAREEQNIKALAQTWSMAKWSLRIVVDGKRSAGHRVCGVAGWRVPGDREVKSMEMEAKHRSSSRR